MAYKLGRCWGNELLSNVTAPAVIAVAVGGTSWVSQEKAKRCSFHALLDMKAFPWMFAKRFIMHFRYVSRHIPLFPPHH